MREPIGAARPVPAEVVLYSRSWADFKISFFALFAKMWHPAGLAPCRSQFDGLSPGMYFRATTSFRPSLWPRIVLVLAFVAMNFFAGASSVMATPVHVPAAEALASEARPANHHMHASHHGNNENAVVDDTAADCPPHRDGSANGANCCAAGCLMLGLPVDLLPSFVSHAEAVFLLPSPQFVASATGAHLRPPRA
jgi:hypothetical protein